jgi:hypothetical protein
LERPILIFHFGQEIVCIFSRSGVTFDKDNLIWRINAYYQSITRCVWVLSYLDNVSSLMVALELGLLLEGAGIYSWAEQIPRQGTGAQLAAG